MNKKNSLKILTGALAGFVGGLFGGGGGMIVVPLLIFLVGSENKKAHATAIAVILPVTVVSVVVYLFNVPFDFAEGAAVTVGVLIGGVIGSFVLKASAPKAVTIAFCVVMLATGVKLLFF